MDATSRAVLWGQFGAAIDMLRMPSDHARKNYGAIARGNPNSGTSRITRCSFSISISLTPRKGLRHLRPSH